MLLSFSLKAQDETSERLATDSDGLAYPYALITNVPGRTTTSLAGRWDVIVDQYDNGFYNYRMKRNKDSSTYFADKHYWRDSTRLIEYDFDRAESLYVPGDWNTQKEKLYFYEGSIWYRKLFSLTPAEGKRYFLYFGAANYDAVVGINGRVIGHHIGGYTPFCFEVSSLLKDGENSLVVKVNNNRILDGVPTINSDWWNYGGLTRDVKVIETPDEFIRDYFMRLDESGRKIEGWVQLDGEGLKGRKVSISIPELKWKILVETDESGKGYFSKSAKPQRWSTSSPKLYAVDLSAGSDAMSDKVGFRTISTRGSSILLNDEPVFLKGVALHEERLDGGGRAWSREHAESLLSSAAGIVGVILILLWMHDTPESKGLPSIEELSGEKAQAEAAAIFGINPIFGIIGTVFSGWLSDAIFKGNRNYPAFAAGVLEAIALALFLFGGPGKVINIIAMVLFGIAIGVLVSFIGGLMAVDLVPRKASGAALGIVGVASYAAAGIQNVVTGTLLDAHIVDGVHDFTYASWFWIGAAVISFLLPILNWKRKKQVI